MPPIKTTHLLIGANVLVFAAMLVFGGRAEVTSFSSETLLVFGADYGPLVREGHWYRPLTSTFIHLNGLHLLLNMVALYQLGLALEAQHGRRRYTFLYVAAGLAGSAASLAWNYRDPVISAGASGAITGLIGAAAVSAHFAGERGLPLRNAMLRWLVSVFFFGLAVHADHAAHLGGLLAGAAIGYLFHRRRPGLRLVLAPSRATDRFPGVEALALLVLLGLAFGDAARRRDDALSPVSLMLRGIEQTEAGDHEAAIRSYRRALQLKPGSALAQLSLGLALGRTGAHDEAVQALTLALPLYPDGGARLVLVDEYSRHALRQATAGKLDEGETAVRAGLALDDTDAYSLFVLSHIQHLRKDHAGAVASLRKAVAAEPTNDMKRHLAAALGDLAVALGPKGKHSEAIPLYREAIQLDPEQPLTHYNLALSLYKTRQYEPARAAVQRSIALFPSKSAFHLLALLHATLGDPEAAAEAHTTADTLPEESP